MIESKVCFITKPNQEIDIKLQRVSLMGDCKLVGFNDLLLLSKNTLYQAKIDLRYYDEYIGFEVVLANLIKLQKLKIVFFNSERWLRMLQLVPENLSSLTLVATSHAFGDQFNQIVSIQERKRLK